MIMYIYLWGFNFASSASFPSVRPFFAPILIINPIIVTYVIKFFKIY